MLVGLFVLTWLAALLAIRLVCRGLRWLVDRGTARRDHAAYRARVTDEWRGRFRN